MSDFTIERRPVQGSPRRVRRRPQKEYSLQERCVHLLQVDEMPAEQRQFVSWMSEILLKGAEISAEQKGYLGRLWSDYCGRGAG